MPWGTLPRRRGGTGGGPSTKTLRHGKSEPEANHQDLPPQREEEKAQETMIIGGKVREIMEDGFVISRVQYADDDMTMVVLPEEGSPEEELVTVRCTDSTAFEHWVIQGGGAGIDMNEATFADIQKGGGLETEGYFDGDNFVAEKVIIETSK